MGTKKPASPTAVVAAGRQCLRPPLPQRQGLIERYPRMSRESIIAAAAPTVTRSLMPHGLPSHAHNAASAAKTRAQESLLVGANRYHDFKRPKCPTHCWSTQAPAFADRHLLRLSHECTARFPGSPHSRRNGSAQTGFVDCCKISNWPLRPTRLISGRNGQTEG